MDVAAMTGSRFLHLWPHRHGRVFRCFPGKKRVVSPMDMYQKYQKNVVPT